MVETKQFCESEFLSVDLVKSSNIKNCVIITEPVGKYSVYGLRLTCVVEINKKQKIWKMNKNTVVNLQVLGSDSKNWIGKIINLEIIKINGKDSIIGTVIKKR